MEGSIHCGCHYLRVDGRHSRSLKVLARASRHFRHMVDHYLAITTAKPEPLSEVEEVLPPRIKWISVHRHGARSVRVLVGRADIGKRKIIGWSQLPASSIENEGVILAVIIDVVDGDIEEHP